MSRWIAVSADLLNSRHRRHPHSKGHKACEAFAWIDLIGLAAWRAHGGLERGQARASQRFLAERWHWDRKTVRRFLEELEAEGAIERAHGTARQPDRITICNYDAYQQPGPTNGAATSPANSPKEVPTHLPTSKRTRARRNGERKPARSVGPDMSDTYSDPERIASIRHGLTGRPAHVSEIDILDGLKKQVGE